MFGLRPPATPDDIDTPTQARYMSKRDHTATQIVVGMLSHNVPPVGGYEDIAKRAYKMADAMIRESKR